MSIRSTTIESTYRVFDRFVEGLSNHDDWQREIRCSPSRCELTFGSRESWTITDLDAEIAAIDVVN